MPTWFIIVFWFVAAVASVLLGVFCLDAHDIAGRDQFPRAYKNHQIWFNFVGSLFGWAALWHLVRRAYPGWWSPTAVGQVTRSDFALGIVAFIGITGWLPYGMKSSLDAVSSIVQEGFKRALKLLTGE